MIEQKTKYNGEDIDQFDIHTYSVLQCQKNPYIDDYRSFDEIPQDQRTESALVAWLQTGSGNLAAIPKELRTARMLHVAARHDGQAMLQIKPSDVSNYREVALDGAKNYPNSMGLVDPEFIDEQFIIDAAISNAGVLYSFDKETLQSYITERAAREICSSGVGRMMTFLNVMGSELVKDEYIVDAIKVQYSDYAILEPIGKLHLLIEMLGNGFWPAPELFTLPIYQDSKVPPSSPLEALKRLSLAGDRGFKILHRSWLLAQPQAEVVEALQASQKGLDELFDLYDEGQLRGYAKKHRSIAGRLVGNDLGI
ncbi:hypothetical protein [Pseudomonas putida]|uniref:Uncharacterized protein n=1 Tax=Pseudomonas putida TaxID=303 RepID=A0A8I1EAA5_PSEPU|nr:hypothetical protein [Pseudomonas putida]MBI6882734.1 hypothetical protein [Pseudomonas putida]